MKTLLIALSLALLGPADTPPSRQPIDEGTVKNAIDRGANALIGGQRPDGSYGTYVGDSGISGLVLHALAVCPRKYREEDGPFVSEAVEYVLSQVQENGGIYEKGQGLWNYKTSINVLALIALDADRTDKRYTKTIVAARDFITTLQTSEASKPLPYDPEVHKRAFGGVGYGSDRRPDLSNTQWALEALKESGLSEDSDVWKNAVKFLERCQNRGASNDTLDGARARSTEDGGFMYAPLDTKAAKTTHDDGTTSYSSYGSMTYAGVKSYVYAGLTLDDPRVRAAYDWICKHYALDHNPGMEHPDDPGRGQMGLFYYYLVMARTLSVLGVDTVETPDGVKHDWARELAAQLISLQRADGTWINPQDRWLEGDPAVVTAYAVRTLSIIHDAMKD